MTLHEKTYGVPLKSIFNPNHGRLNSPFFVTLKLSIPPSLPKDAKGSYFAEHVYNRYLKSTTEHVILTGRSMIVESRDNGDTWDVIRLSSVEKRRLYNCFTMDNGHHIVQALPEKDDTYPSTHTDVKKATLFLFDEHWNLLSTDDQPTAQWHGRASIDQSGNTIMFAEYHYNPYKYIDPYKDDEKMWMPLMEPNRVFRSRDGGKTWNVVFEAPRGFVRHLHTLQADPFLKGAWWLSSGDRSEESRVWRSDDDGDTWVDVTDTHPDIDLPKMYTTRKQAAFRYTDIIITKDQLIWGADDLLGDALESGPEFPQNLRAGSRIYSTPKSNPLKITELAYIGHPVRSIVDVGPAYIVITESNRQYYPLTPQVVALFKDNMTQPIEIARIDNFQNKKTAFSSSKASKSAVKGRFFSYRYPTDVFKDVRPCVLQWDIAFSD